MYYQLINRTNIMCKTNVKCFPIQYFTEIILMCWCSSCNINRQFTLFQNSIREFCITIFGLKWWFSYFSLLKPVPLSVRGKGKTFFGFALSVIIVVFGSYAHTYINFKIVRWCWDIILHLLTLGKMLDNIIFIINIIVLWLHYKQNLKRLYPKGH